MDDNESRLPPEDPSIFYGHGGWKALATDVTQEGDFTTRGADGRDWQVAILGLHAVVWWVDHAVCEVKIVAIRPADR